MNVGQCKRVLVWYWGRKGGGARYTHEVARSLSRNPSLDVHISLSRQSEIYDESRALQLPWHDVDTYSGLLSGMWNTLFLRKTAGQFITYLDQQSIDLVLCTMRHPWTSWIARQIRSEKRRYIFTVHDAYPHEGDEHIGWEWILKTNLQHADGVLVLCEHVRKELTKRYSYPQQRIWVASHGPIQLHGHSLDKVPTSQPRRLLFFGRILPYKGLSLLLDAFDTIAEELDLELAVVGRGDMDDVKDRIADHPRIRIDNRWVPENELPDIFQAADIVVMPYLEASQSGVVAAAYGMGLPVVVTPVGGLSEQIKDGETGIIASQITPGALADAIGSLCKDNSLYQRCCRGAKQTGNHEVVWDQIADITAGAVEDVCARSPFSGAVVAH